MIAAWAVRQRHCDSAQAPALGMRVGRVHGAENDTSSPDDEKALRQLEWEEENQEDDDPGLWSAWSAWSQCSRTCDGGAIFQIRSCNSVSRCKGSPVRYKICNMQPCPDNVEFRELQCASFNSVPHRGQLLTWTPHYDDDHPCALICRAHSGEVSQLAASVRDGTRCRPGSLDMCIDGKCQRVGCDLEIGSGKKVDECGVCGGDGSSCAQPLYHWAEAPVSLCSVSCGGGYKMSQAVCRNRVTGADVDSQLCNASQQPEPQVVECNTHRCPPKWLTEDWGRCTVTCGGGTRQRSVICTEEANGTRAKVPDHFCRGHRPRSVEPCNSTPCPPTWVTGDWSGCSVSCGEGVQTRNVSCRISRYDKPGSTSCNEATQPSSVQPCNTGITCPEESDSEPIPDIDEAMPLLHPYPPFRPTAEKLVGEQLSPSSEPNTNCSLQVRLANEEVPLWFFSPIKMFFGCGWLYVSFIAGSWGPCSVTCGEGSRSRKVNCKIYLDFSRTYATLPDSKCQGPKPAETERCSEQPCSFSNSVDTVRDGYGDLSYADTYRSGSYSDTNIRVAPGSSGKTYSWKEQGFTHCSASCLGGVQESVILCVRNEDQKSVSPYLCPQETRPEILIKTCNDHPCPPRWNHSEFSQCSKACGIGIQTRDVNCIHEVTRGGGNTIIVPNNMCPQPPPPDRQYCNVLDCPVKWHTSDWTKCSKSCGGGIKTRVVECKQVMAQNHVVSRPESQCPSVKPQDRRPCNTKQCPSEEQNPTIAVANITYIQHNASKKKVNLKIGGQAQVFYGTQVKIKCPVKKFNRTRIQWAKDHKVIGNNKKYRISKKGALRIADVTYVDSGVYTCIAGRSSADVAITVKPRPGVFPSSEEIERQHHNQLDPAMQPNGEMPGRPFLGPGDDMSHEIRPGDNLHLVTKKPPRATPPPYPPPDTNLHTNTNLWPQHHSGTTTNSQFDQDGLPNVPSEDPLSSLEPSLSSAGSRPMPHFQQLLANLQTLWPFQTFGNSRGHRMVMEEAPPPPPLVTTTDFGGETSTTEDSSIVVLGKGSPENVKFDWLISEWSACSQTCGGNGFQIRKAHCMVRLHNATQDVDSNLCVDAGLETPITVQKCGAEPCPRWVAEEWSSCHESRCFTWDTAMQKRDITCRTSNNTEVDSKHCIDVERPIQRKECYNDKCKGTWKVGEWSECAAPCEQQGVKYRILQCVWYGTKKPAGNACRDQPRPSVMKICKGPPCSSAGECKDQSKYCENVRVMNMCRMQRYQTQCCQSCRNNN
ncbi:protein madd-4-like [Macrosteles quadrilineatus]|uniref:protein madd-4-like n=1 Tax=Macrosteles quadrilineatus TaxID=74068 RepID=UPI0023E13E24|nr:protein madd-4-like [Macrosteles quadrilineatus]